MELKKYPAILEAAHRAWQRMEPDRQRRLRFTRFTYGDQWGDPIIFQGLPSTERDVAAKSGRPPLTNNLIRRLVKSVVGRYRQDNTRGSSSQSDVPAATKHLNRLDELDARTLEEFLISGMAIHRVCAEHRPAGTGIWVDNVSPDRFFISDVTDPRCLDMELVGRLIDMSISELVMRFAGNDDRRANALGTLYDGLTDGDDLPPILSRSDIPDFYHPVPGRCRVIEIWTLECREVLCVHDHMEATLSYTDISRENQLKRQAQRRRRRRLPPLELTRRREAFWHGRFLAPDGTLLGTASAPDGKCPFAVKMYPMVDGHVHSLVEDVIDQQKYVNRLISLMDHMMGTAAKGVLLFPTQCKADGFSWNELAKIWADPAGIIPYKSSQYGEPHQVVAHMSDIGARDMLQTQIKLFEDVSGVSQALLGKAVSDSVGVERYESEIRNAAAAIADLMETYRDFVSVRNGIIRAVSESCKTTA